MSTITNELQIYKGLEGIYADTTTLSNVNGKEGILTIRGYRLEEFADKASHEEVIYLLLYGKFPNKQQLKSFVEKISHLREIPEITINLLRAAASAKNHPMDALRMGVASLSIETGEIFGDVGRERNIEVGLRVIATLPTMLAAFWRFKEGKEAIHPRKDLSHAANFLYMLTGQEPSSARERALTTYLNTVGEHGLNASTFTGRVIVSTDSDLISAVTGSIGALKGPKHGGAPGPALDMIFEIQELGGIDQAEKYIRTKLDNKERIMGFGHRVYEVRDPRAYVLSHAAKDLFQDRQGFYEFVTAIEDKVIKLLEEYKPGRRIQTNVEFYTALVLHGVGLEPDIFSSIFAMARTSGWIAHDLEQLENNRLIRPRIKYTGDFDKKWVSVENR
jgi:citrate synthase